MWTLPKPRSGRHVDPVFHWLDPGTVIHRVFDPARYDATATGFRYDGPLQRFDHHVHQEKRGIMYAAENFGGALSLVFGNHAAAGYALNHHYSIIALERALRMLDLTGQYAPKAGADVRISTAPTLGTAQEWSRHFYSEPTFNGINGLMYTLDNGSTVYAIYDRSFDGVVGFKQLEEPLASGEVRDQALIWAARLRLKIDFGVTVHPDI